MGRKRTGGIETRGARRYARITVTLENGKKARRRVRIDAAIPRREARTLARKVSQDAEHYIFDAKDDPAALVSPTVEQFHTAWAQDREHRGRRSERGRYKKHIHPLIGSKRMSTVTKDDARALSAAIDEKVLAKELHWSTGVKVWGVAKKMFRDAVESKVAALRVLETNPFDGVAAPERGEPKGKQWLYPSEVWALLSCPKAPLRWRELTG
jgi:hypothetical protein